MKLSEHPKRGRIGFSFGVIVGMNIILWLQILGI